MFSELTRNRVRRSTCELCEPRQMLSVAPVAPLDVQLDSPAYEWRLESNLAIVMLDSKVLFKDARVADFLVVPHFSGESDGWNMYGTRNWPAGSLVPSTGAAQATPFGNNVWGSVPWQSIKAPQLDPISASPPGLSPIRVGAGDTGIAPQPVRASAAIDTGFLPASPRAPNSELPTTITPARSVGAVEENIRPNWLPVAFSPEEQHRLDATTVDAHFERTVAARDPRTRFALEPTRVTCQTFCDPVTVPSSGQDDAAEQSTDPVPKPAGEDRGAEQPVGRLPQENTTGPIGPAIRDAAILDWESSHAAALPVSATATRPGQRTAGRPGHSTASRDDHEASESPADSTVAQFLDDNKNFAAVVLAALATKTLWSYGAGAHAQSAAATVKLLRKRLARSG